MKMLSRLFCVFTLSATLWMCLPAAGQVSTGTLQGSVQDPSGAAIHGANVTVTNAETGVVTTAHSNHAGLFTVPNLQAGTYRVEVTSSGFASQVAPDVTLDVGEVQAVNFSLKVGSSSEMVVVTSAAPEVELVSSTTMPVVDGKTIVELPLNGRDWASLAALEPGVAAVRTQSAVSISNQRANRGVGNQLTVSGARPQMNNYRVDGISINDYSNGGPGGVIGSNLGVDAIQEFSVVTGEATADYGKTAGGIINAVTRTAGNKIHGDVYEFFRNSALDTRNPFDPPNKVSPLRRNQFGASAGGPLKRDRTFVFGDYEGLRWFNSSNVSSTVPSNDARNGIMCVAAGGNSCASHTTVKIDPAVAPYIPLFPLPNNAAAPALGQGTSDTGQFLFADPFNTKENYFTIRFDHKLGSKDQLWATYFWDSGSYTGPDPFNEKVTGNIAKRQMASVSESHAFTPALLNNVHIGYSRVVSDAPTTLNALDPALADPSLGFVPTLPVGLINVGGLTFFTGGLHAVGEFIFHYNSYQAYDDFYWTKGRHAMKFGFAFEALENNQLGTANPNGQFTFNNWVGFLQNQATGFNAPFNGTNIPKDLRQQVYAGYATDDFHVTRRLTVNAGLRYELTTVPTETRGRLSNLPTLTAATPNLGSRYFQNSTERDFEPRIGFTLSPFADGMTAVHGGFGIYTALPLNYLYEGLSVFAAPFFESGSISSSAALLGTFPKNAYPQLTPATFRYSYTPQNPSLSYMEQYGLNVQHEFPGAITATVGYAGSHGVHLPYRVDDINTVQPIAEVSPGVYEFPSLKNNIVAATANPRINTNVGQISAMLPIGMSNYNALQVGVNKRLSHHYQFQLSYTWQKSMDDGSSSTFGDTFANSVSSLPYFAKDVRYAVSDFNVGQVFVLSYLVLLPEVKKLGPAGWALDSWQWGGIFTATTGMPVSPLISGDPMGLRSSDAFGFPNRVPGCNPVNKQNKTHFLNPACFTYPTETAAYNPFLGNSGRNSVEGPGLQDLDMSLTKNNPIKRFGDQFNIQFRAEMFNILNRSNYANPLKAATQMFSAAPAPSAGTPNPALNGAAIASAGALTLTSTSSRQTQFALKVIF